MKYAKITPAELYGSIKAPPSKSICHRAIIAAGLSKGICRINNVIFSDDILATINAMVALGVDIKSGKNSLLISGNGIFTHAVSEIDCGESGSTLRFLIPPALLTGERITFTGKGRLSERPLHPYYKIFENCSIYYSGADGLPLTIQGTLTPGDFKIEGDISSQFITGLLFALPLLHDGSRIILTAKLESRGYVDLTIDVLKKFNIEIENNNYSEFYIKGNQEYNAVDYCVEGDISQAAFYLSAGVLGGNIVCSDININSLQGDMAIVDIIKRMGGNISIYNDSIETKTSKLHGITVDASECPDIVPIISVLGALSSGRTEIINAKRLRLKESDRLKAMASELNKLGADVMEMEDGLMINGKENLGGGAVHSFNDHRIAMALSVASIKCTNAVTITNTDSIKKSYPGFFHDFSILGGIVDERNMGE